MKRDCHKARALKLLPYAIRENLPLLGSQQGWGGTATAWTRWSTPDGSHIWYVSEGSARRDPEGRAVDYLLFGLVDGLEKELGYVALSELEAASGPLGLPIERDLWWEPKTLEEIAPEIFRSEERTEG